MSDDNWAFAVTIACEASFPFGFEAKNEERESETTRKLARVKNRGGGGEENKETRFLPSPLPSFIF